jgi:hypothetical protein
MTVYSSATSLRLCLSASSTLRHELSWLSLMEVGGVLVRFGDGQRFGVTV